MYLPDISADRYSTDCDRRRRRRRRLLSKNEYWFYFKYSLIVVWSGVKFFFTRDPQKAVTLQARRVMRLVENQGVHLTFEGLDQYPSKGAPFVFACNHMGTFEVNALPGLIASRIPMTFVVKRALLKTPFFGQVLRKLRAIPVRRRNPGEDLRQVLEEGSRLLAEGVSVILFPESTRQDVFSYRKFNSLAIKLALRAGVPVVPAAIRTDFWGVGKIFKNYGPLKPELPSRIAFGAPIMPKGRGRTEHRQVLDFIAGQLEDWGSPVERDSPVGDDS